MSYLKCRTCGGRVCRGRPCEAGSLKGLHVGVTVQLTHVANPSIHSQWQTAQRCFIERMDLFLHCETLAWVGKKKGGDGFVTSWHHGLSHMDTETLADHTHLCSNPSPLHSTTVSPCLSKGQRPSVVTWSA